MKRRFKLRLPTDRAADRQCKYFEYHPGAPEIGVPARLEEHTVDASPCLVGFSGMQYPKTNTIYQPIDHESQIVSYDGSFPCPYDLDETHHYGDFGGVDIDGVYIAYVPIRQLVDTASTFLPGACSRSGDTVKVVGWPIRWGPE